MWKPSEEEKKYLELLLSMVTDCLLGRGTEDEKTFLANLKLIANRMDEGG